MKNVKMFNAIQKKMRIVADSAMKAFMLIDRNNGFLTLKDFQNQLPTHFDVTLKREEVLKLFKEIDTEKDGLISYKEFEEFY